MANAAHATFLVDPGGSHSCCRKNQRMSRSPSTRVRRLVFAGVACAALLTLPNHAQAKDDELAPKHVLLNVPEAKAKALGDKGDSKAKRPPPTSNGISYHGGPLILNTVNAYVIWYGNWTGNSAVTLIPSFLGSVGGSPYFNINTTYYNGSNVHVTGAVTYVGSTTDNYSRGTVLSDAGVQGVVSDAISSGRLPSDTTGVYF